MYGYLITGFDLIFRRTSTETDHRTFWNLNSAIAGQIRAPWVSSRFYYAFKKPAAKNTAYQK